MKLKRKNLPFLHRLSNQSRTRVVKPSSNSELVFTGRVFHEAPLHSTDVSVPTAVATGNSNRSIESINSHPKWFGFRCPHVGLMCFSFWMQIGWLLCKEVRGSIDLLSFLVKVDLSFQVEIGNFRNFC